MDKKTSIAFWGATQTVTGSKYLVKTGNKNIMIDCGLFQGEKELRLLNWKNLPVPPKEIDLVLLTHGHLDHTGYLPRLVQGGYKNEIWGTAPTLDITSIILHDSAKIQEEDAARANKEQYSKHHPALPLYDEKDVKKVIPLMKPKPLDEWITIDDHVSCRFNYNGHILGAAFIELKIGDRIIVFSGDIGRKEDPLLYPPHRPEKADLLLMETTYGDRLHPTSTLEQLAEIIHATLDKGGTLVIPGFAVERSQMLVYMIHQLKEKKLIPAVPVYLDSPMASHAMEIFNRYPSWHKLSPETCRILTNEVLITQSLEETFRIADSKEPKIIIAGSGMVNGGRVLSYLAKYVGDVSATILLAGYQATGTRGRTLLEGAKEIKMFGKYFPVRARIQNLEGISSHGDQAELIDWIKSLKQAPEKIFLVHGERKSAEALRNQIEKKYGFTCEIPGPGQEYFF